MRKILTGTLLGAAAGVIDIIPMIIQKLPIDADISAFLFWVVSGFFIATTELKINPVLKGIIIPFLILTPSAVIIGAKEPFSLIPITIMTLILGSLLGLVINKLLKTSNNQKK